jgi:predicted HTH transcriptional regulator
MSEFFKKSINDLTREDIEGLKGTLEGQTFEIKERLSESGSEEIWEREPQIGKDRDGPSDKAKEKIFKEIVAFANPEGGWLVLGIKETDESPSKASDICPIPDCCVLADRLWQASQDWIDPPLSLHVRGIEIDGKKGVVVLGSAII